MRNKPIIITVIHGQDKSFLGYILEKTLSWIDDFRIAVSEDTKKTYIAQGVAKRDTFVIHNGMDLETFDNIPVDKDYLYKELKLDKNIKLVGMIAYFYTTSTGFDVKGHKVFLNSANILLKKDPFMRFVFVGSNLYGYGNYMEQIQQYTKSLGIEDSVFFLGKRDDIPNILDSLSVLVLPSLVREGFGLVLIEAMARGIPTIGSNIGGIPEVIADGETGLLIPPGNTIALANAIETILSDPEKAKAMGMAGRRRVEKNFTADIMAQKFVDLTNKLIEYKNGKQQ
jgi:glycosyltransferase involved in cell wall biosynthesis